MSRALFFLMFLCVGCARYDATSLTSLSSELIQNGIQYEGVVIAAKAFTKVDCKRYLDRDVIKRGYQPIQLYIENGSEKTYLFSPSRISLPLVPPAEVAKQVHTSTWGRIMGYSAAALAASPLTAVATPFLIIPAVVDGFKSSAANDSLDQDFASKGAKELVVYPKAQINMVIFVPVDDYQETFTVTLLDDETNKPKRFIISS